MDKKKIAIASVSLLAAFAAGRFLTPTKIVEVEKVVEIVKKDKSKQKSKDTTIVEKTNPDGSKEKTTVVKEKTDSKTTEDKIKSEEKSKEIVKNSSRLNISVMGGGQLNSSGVTPVFGGHVSKDLLGPVSVGGWGMSNGSAGVSVGLTF